MARRTIDHEFLYDLPALSAPRISPDGERVVYVRTDIDRERQQADSHLELVGARGGQPRRLTVGPRDSAPVWSPEGATIAFLRTSEEDQPAQLWLLPIDGGEARRLSELDAGVAAYCWAPDGGSLVAVSRIDPDAPSKEERASDVPRVKVVRDRIRYRGDGEGWFGAARAQLFRIDADQGRARRLTRGDHNHTQPAASPDGSTVAFVSSDRGRRRHRREPMGTELCLIPAEGGRITRLVRDGWNITTPVWSSDGTRIAFAAANRAESQRYVYCVDVATGAVDRLTTDVMTPMVGPGRSDLAWAGPNVLFAADVRGATGIYAASRHGVEAIRRPAGTAMALTVSDDGRRGAMLATTTNRPPELVTLDLRTGRRRRVTEVTAPFVKQHDLVDAEPFRVRRAGHTIEGWLMHPPGYDPSKQYPLVLSIHGGPASHFSPMFVPLHQQFAAAGMHVLYLNPRGSTSYGARWAAAVNGDWGGEDYEDLMAAVDAASARSDIDARRLGVYGYS